MKKLFATVLALTGVFALAACGGGKGGAKYKDGEEHYCITGPACLKVNGKTAEQAGGAAWDFGGGEFILKESTVQEVKTLDATVGSALEAKGTALKSVHFIKGVEFGVEDAGYTKAAMINGAKKIANGSYTFKIVKAQYGAEDDVWAVQNWIPDPHTAHAEVLTPSNFFVPTWQEAADEDGFSWADDSVVIGGAGIYTVVFAEYTTPASEESCNYGIALIKTEAKSGQEYTDAPTENSYSLIGSFGGHSWDYDLDMTENNGIWSVQATFAEGDEFKVRMNHAWAGGDVGWNENITVPAGAFENHDGNIKCLVAGTYLVSFDAANSAITIAGSR